jgi:hypothetical protein
MKIALIGPGLGPIPPDNWGACESVIWNYYLELIALGHEPVIFNNNNLQQVSDSINSQEWDWIQLHYDEYAAFFLSKLSDKKDILCITNHYGWFNKPEMWGGYYPNLYWALGGYHNIIALSDSIRDNITNNPKGYNPKNNIATLRNGAEVSKFKFQLSPTKKAICIGKIEDSDRKQQIKLAEFCDKSNIEMDFVGPICTNRFKVTNTSKYLGTWNKEQLYNNLTEYSTLVLMSNGEAAPLVIPEAFAAGLNVVVSKSASANINEDCPNAIVLPDAAFDKRLIDAINTSNSNIDMRMRVGVRKWAELYWGWNIITKEYIEIIKRFKNGI